MAQEMHNVTSTGLLYGETRSLGRSWLSWVLMAVCLLVLAGNSHSLYLQWRATSTVASRSMLTEPVTLWSVLMILVALGLLWASRRLRLKVELTPAELKIVLEPLFRRALQPDQVSKWEVLRANPGQPRGGATSRMQPSGWATGTKGATVVCLHLAGGKPIFVDIGRPDEFVQALEAWKGGAKGSDGAVR